MELIVIKISGLMLFGQRFLLFFCVNNARVHQ